MSTESNEENPGNETTAGNPPVTGNETPNGNEAPAGNEENPGNNEQEESDPKWLKKILEPLAGAVTTLSQKQSETMDELRTLKADLTEMKAAKSTLPASQEPPSGMTSPETKTETSSETRMEPPKESGDGKPPETGAESQLQKVRREILKL